MSVSFHMLKNPVHFFAFGLGTGLSPIAPGTAGSLLGVAIYLLIARLAPLDYAMWLLIFMVFCVWVCGASSRQTGLHDDPRIVLDEIAGYLVTMAFVPFNVIWIVAGFVLFRLFDIFKPWPIRLVDRRLKGGLGIVLDDIIAGLFSLLILHFAVWSVKWAG